MTWAYGKVILFGEHAVVYGHPALAGALDLTLEARFTRAPASPHLRVVAPDWDGLDVAIDMAGDTAGDAAGDTAGDTASDGAGSHPVARAVRALIAAARRSFAAALPASALRGVIEIATRVPCAAGLGSSAALCVACARLLLELAAAPGGPAPERVSDAEIERVADAGERVFHDNPSGVDVALAARGGLGVFVRGRGLEPVAAPPLSLVIALSGQPRRTADMVARVAEMRAREPAAVDRDLAELGGLAIRGRHALERGEVVEVGRLMSQAQRALGRIGVSSAALDQLIELALGAGALGAKLTGAGGGGAIIAAARDAEHAERVARQLARRDITALACRVGVTRP